MCVCIYLCICVNMYIYIHISIHEFIPGAPLPPKLHSLQAHIRYVYKNTFTCIHGYVYICVYVYTGLSPFSRSRPTCLPPTCVYIYTCIYYTYLIYISWVLRQIRSCVLKTETEPAVKPGDFSESIFTNE